MSIKIFFCYAHEDKVLLNKLKIHLSPLQKQGIIDIWYDGEISTGMRWKREINSNLNMAQVILLLISANFMVSEYCYSTEMKHVIDRHRHGEIVVIPIILRPVYWQNAPFGDLQVLPTNAKPVVSSSWRHWDEALLDVTKGIYRAIKQLDLSKSVSVQTLNLQITSDQEKLSSTDILISLRKLYVITHDNVSPGIVTGTDPLPKQWVEEQLDKMGEIWRQETYY